MKPLAGLVLFAAASGQGPGVANARLETRAVTSLESEVVAITGPAWAGYEVPAARKDASSCCWGDGWRGCGLEGDKNLRSASTGPVMLEGTNAIFVLFRVTSGKVEKTRAFSSDCALDAGGLPFTWLTGVTPAASAAFLSKLGEKALPALAMQGGAEADDALVRLAREQTTGKARGQALFWLAQKASQKAAATIQDSIDNDPDTEVKKKAVFALSQMPKDEGVPKLIEVAKSNHNKEVRKQAMFWLGQSQDPRALQFLEDTLLK